MRAKRRRKYAFVGSPAGASDAVSNCVAGVMADYGWTEAEATRLQPRTIQIQGQSYPIRRGGTLELACREWAADKAILEMTQLQAENAQLRRTDAAQAETLGTMSRSLAAFRSRLSKLESGFWFEKSPRVLFLLNVFQFCLLLFGILSIRYARQINNWHRRMEDRWRRWRQNRRPPPINLMPPR